MDASDDNQKRKRPKISDLLAKTVIPDGKGGARCPWCTHHQELYVMGNFYRHIVAKHPKEADEEGILECKRRIHDPHPIPESMADLVRTDDAGTHCLIANGQCRYMQLVFNVKRFQRHVCFVHPWEAMQRNMSLGKCGGTYTKLHQMILQYVTYDENGIHCRIDPNSRCSYRGVVMFPKNFKSHFMDHHPEQAERYGFFQNVTERITPTKGLPTKPLTHLVEEYVYIDEEGCHCKLEPGCDYTIKGFSHEQLVAHFRHQHPALAKAKGFFFKKQSKQIRKCTYKDADGDYHCRIDGACAFMQRKFYWKRFLRHFRFKHPRAANEMNLFEYQNKCAEAKKRVNTGNRYSDKVEQQTVTDEHGTYCRIAGPTCEYMQTTFRPNNFRRHFRYAHPKEAKEKGFFEGTSVAMEKSEFPHPTAGNQQKRPLEKPNYIQLLQGCTIRDRRGIHCKISANYCRFKQKKLFIAGFVGHIRRDHPEEALAKGFIKGSPAKKKIKMEALDDLLDIKEEVGADDEKEQSSSEASECVDWGLLTPDEAPPSLRPLTSIHQLLEENTLRVKTDVFCKISAEHCDFNLSEGFEVKNFVRHFRFKHPVEAREKGFFGEDPTIDELPLSEKSFRHMVTENVYVDNEGVHCMISETVCNTFQIGFSVGNFVRHFRKEHPQEAEERGFVGRKHYSKRRKRSQPEDESLDTSELHSATTKRQQRKTLRALVEKYIVKNSTGIHCKLSKRFCRYVQTGKYRYLNFYRHFLVVHPEEAQAAGIVAKEEKENHTRAKYTGKPSFAQLVKEYTVRDDKGVHCRISATKCTHVQKSKFVPGNFVRHFRSEHPKEARRIGFFRDESTDNDTSVAESESESEDETIAQDVKMESFDLEENEPETICPDTPNEDHPLQRKYETLKDIAEKYIERTEDGVYCRISQKPCKYSQKGTCNHYNLVSHFRLAHPKEACAAGISGNINATVGPDPEPVEPSVPKPPTPTLVPDPEPVERIVSHESDAQDAAMESFSCEESQPKIPCPDTPIDRRRTTNRFDGCLTQKKLVEKYVFRDAIGVHCRISEVPCKYVQKGIYTYQNFVRHFRAKHTNDAKKIGFFSEFSEPETEDEQPEPMESLPVDPEASEDERRKSKSKQPSLRMLAKKFVFRDEKGIHCRISSQPCRFIQKGTYKYMNVVRHFRHEHAMEATEAGFFREYKQDSEADQETVEQEDSDTDIPLELDLGGKTGLIELVAKYVYRNQKGIHCRISSLPCSYRQVYGFKYQNFIAHFIAQHTEEAEKAGFLKNADETLEPEPEPELESVGGISRDSIMQDETMESFTTEQSQSDIPEASKDPDFLKKKSRQHPSLKRLTSMYVSRDKDGAHCRIASSRCRYVQRYSYVVANFVRHFRTAHPKEARKAGFFRGIPNPEPVPEPAPTEEIKESTACEETQDSSPGPSKTKPKRPINFDGTPTFTELAEKCIHRTEEGIFCQIVPWPLCKYVQKSNYVAGNFVRHFRKEHPKEARQIGFFKGFTILEPEANQVEPPLVSIPQDATEESVVLEESQPEKPCPDTSLNKPKRIRKYKRQATLTKLAEKCILRDEEGVHCRIVPWPPCRYVQRYKYVAGNFFRHFRNEHPKEARKMGFFKGMTEPETESETNQLVELPLVSIPSEPAAESFELEESQPEEPCLDTPHEDPTLYCRLCFSVDLPLSPIFSGPDSEDNPLVESIEECINVHLTAEDEAWICSECSQKLVDFQQFRQLSRIHDSAVRQKKQRLASALNNAAVVDRSAHEADSFHIEFVKQENSIEPATIPPVIDEHSATANESCEDQKPFIELPNGSFSCRLCPETFPSLGPTMEHFISAHSESMHTNSVLSVDYSDKPPLRAVTINNVQYLKCADCDTLTKHGEDIIEHRKRFHTGVTIRPTIECDRADCKQIFMDDAGYQRHLEICHGVSESAVGGS